MRLKPKSLKQNFFARGISTTIELGFALFCFPYVANKLGPTALGRVDYFNALTAIFITFVAFGSADYGTREVAMNKDNPGRISEILGYLLKVRLVLATLLFVFYLTFVNYFLGDGSTLFYLSSLLILSASLNIVWSLEGLEDFQYLAVIKVVVKTCFLIFLLIYVQNAADVEIYFLGVIGFDFLYFLLACTRLFAFYPSIFSVNRFVSQINLAELKPLIWLLVLGLLQSAITSAPATILGKLDLYEELGIFSTAQRFFWIGYYAIVPITAVLFARGMSYQINDFSQERHSYLSRAFILKQSLSIPIAVGIFAIAKDVIELFVGDAFFDSVLVLQLLCPLLIVFTLNNFWSVQVLFAFKKERFLVAFHGIALAAVLVLGLLLIPKYQEIGAVISISTGHVLVLLFSYLWGRKFFKLSQIKWEVTKAILAGAGMYLSIQTIIVDSTLMLIIKIAVGAGVYGLVLLLLKHKLALDATQSLLLAMKSKIKKE